MAGFLTEVEGFTPVIDAIVQDVGLMQAIVYGVVWRYCQMPNGVCIASLEQIANRVGISRKTAERHIKALCKSGYLRDATPRVNYKPHIYADTGKTKIKGLLAARSDKESDLGKTESLTGGTESLTPSDRESYPGKTESPTKRVSEESIQETLKENRAPPAANAHPSKPKAKSKPKPKEPKPKTPEAVKVFRQNAHRYPVKAWYSDIAEAVGEEPADLELWGQIVKAYVGLGWNPGNVKNMLAYYEKREIPEMKQPETADVEPHAGIRQWLTEQGVEAQ